MREEDTLKSQRKTVESSRQLEMGRSSLVSLMRMGSHSDAIMLVINPLVSACLGGQILAVWKGLMGNQ